MKEISEITTIEDAWACLVLHFSLPNGLIARIEKGEIIDTSQVRFIEIALQRIKTEWENELVIPKKDIRLLWEILPFLRLVNCTIRYPEKIQELIHLISSLDRWMNQIFVSAIASEEEVAIDNIQRHLVGEVPSFSILLRMGMINMGALDEVFDALDSLSTIWQTREYIPKKAGYPLMNAQNVIWKVSNLYSDAEMERLQKIELQILERVTKCLS